MGVAMERFAAERRAKESDDKLETAQEMARLRASLWAAHFGLDWIADDTRTDARADANGLRSFARRCAEEAHAALVPPKGGAS